MLTYGECVRMLSCFLSAEVAVAEATTVDPARVPREAWSDAPETGIRRPTANDRLLTAIRDRTGCFSPRAGGFPHEHDPISESMWFQAAHQASLPEAPLWDLYDTLRTASTLAFAVPGGVEMSAGIGAFERFVSNLERRIKGRPPREARSALETVEANLDRFISKQMVSQDIKDVASAADVLDSKLTEMLIDPRHAQRATRGFNADWVRADWDKESVLDSTRLGRVWDIIGMPAFNDLIDEQSPLAARPEFGLVDGPSLAMCTIGTYCRVVQTVINGLIVYSLVALMPEDALHPGWDPTSFNLLQAVTSSEWRRKYNGHSARDCWETLSSWLEPSARLTWLRRVDPIGGDARAAFELIRKRIGRISLEVDVEPNRDGRWYLPASRSIDHDVLNVVDAARAEGANDIFRRACAGRQDEVRDTALNDRGCDTFADPFRAFTTRLGINWRPPPSVPLLIEAVTLNKLYPAFTSPWAGKHLGPVDKGTYPQLCWSVASAEPLVQWEPGPEVMDAPIVRAAIGWMGFVLTHYANEMNYRLLFDLEQPVSTFELTQTFHEGWGAVREMADRLMKVGERVAV